MPASPKASKSMTRTTSTASRSWRPPIRVCCRDTVASMSRQYRISRFRNMSFLTSERLSFGGAVLLALISVPLQAHDMWIEPATFAPRPGQIVSLRLRVGQDLLGDPLPRDPALIHQFVVEDGEGRKPVVGRDGSDPAGFVRAA